MEKNGKADVLMAYKGFDAEFKCRDFQFEVGKTYEHDGPVSICSSGFHACEMPFDVWYYYAPHSSQFASVTLRDVSKETSDDSKRVAKKITVEEKLSLFGFIRAQVKWTSELAEKEAATTGYEAHAATTGYEAHAATAGYEAHAATAGDRAHAATAGNRANAATTGKNTIAASLGTGGKAKAGENGVVIVAYWDDKAKRPRIAHGCVGEGGIKADTWYEAKDGQLVEAV